jgi:hypothetical protein
LLNGIDCQESDGVDIDLVEIGHRGSFGLTPRIGVVLAGRLRLLR